MRPAYPVILTLILRLPFMERPVSVPLLQRLWQPDPQAKAKYKDGSKRRREPNSDYPTKPELGRQMLDLIAARLPVWRIELVGDSAYATKAMRGLDERVSVTSRLKSNAKLFAPKPPRTGKRGSPPRKATGYPNRETGRDRRGSRDRLGAARGGPAQASAKRSRCTSSRRCSMTCWGERPVQVVLVRGSMRKTGTTSRWSR
jgi:hypothetical protein